MPSRAESRTAAVAEPRVSSNAMLRVIGGVLHATGLVCMALLAWRLFVPADAGASRAVVNTAGTLDHSLVPLLRAADDTIDVSLDGVPDARTRASIRAIRGAGKSVRLTASTPLAAVAVSAEREWKSSGGTRVQIVSSGSSRQAVSDGAGLIDSIAIDSAGLRTRTGPLDGAMRVQRAAAPALQASLPSDARVLVLGEATWESRFLVAALEEAGWPVDAAVSLSPKVTVTQGPSSTPSRSRHAIVVVLPGAPAPALSALPAFVRGGGGVVIVGEAARASSLAALRVGAPAATISGEAGAEASDDPRHGLDLVPITSLSDGAVVLESRDGRVAVAAKRVGAGRVMQVGYENSWLWRMGGDDDAPAAHRRWWTTLLAGLVPMRAPVLATVAPEHDTLDAAPVAALAHDLGLPAVRTTSAIAAPSSSFIAALDVRWLFTLALLSLVASWALRRWRGLV